MKKQTDWSVPSHFLIHPDSNYIVKWDLVVVFALLFTAFVTPYEIAFLSIQFNTLLIINCLVNLIFLKDSLMQFFLPFWDSSFHGKWVTDLRLIRKNYLRKWFWFDLVSNIPFDILGLLMDSGRVSKLRIIRLVRLFRLVKLLRILRTSRIVARLENNNGILFSVRSLVKFMLATALVFHWLACLWSFFGRMSFDSGETSWISIHFSCSDNADACVNHFQVYTAASYFAGYTIFGIGYGDVVPANTVERWVSVFIMLSGSSFYAYVIGNAANIIGRFDVDTIEYHQTMDSVNQFLEDQFIEEKSKQTVRNYFKDFDELKQTRKEQRLVMTFSPYLRDIMTLKYSSWLRLLSWRKSVSIDFMTILAENMDSALFCPGEVMPSIDHLCIISRGVATKKRLFLKGSSYGEDLLLHSIFLKDKTPAIAVTNTEILFIDRTNLLEVLSYFPLDSKQLRHYSLMLALQRALVLISFFSKCGWKFTHKKTIPFASASHMCTDVGKTYEQYVQQLCRQSSHNSPETTITDDILEKIVLNEKPEKGNTRMHDLLGYHLRKKRRGCSHRVLIDQIEKIEQDLDNLSFQVTDADVMLSKIMSSIQRLISAKVCRTNLGKGSTPSGRTKSNAWCTTDYDSEQEDLHTELPKSTIRVQEVIPRFPRGW